MGIYDNKGIHIMIKQKLTALTLAGLLSVAAGSAFAGSTGPTNPVDTNGPKTGTSSMGQNTDGTTRSDSTSTPGTKGMNNSGSGGTPTTGGMGTDSSGGKKAGTGGSTSGSGTK